MASYEAYEAQSIDILQEAHADFGRQLYILSSFGNDSSLTLRLANEAQIPFRVLGIHTGFRFPETQIHQHQLEQSEGFVTKKYGVSEEVVAGITERKLWKTDLAEYHRLTKTEPLSRAIGELGIKGLVTGVRRSQTDNRAGLERYSLGDDGEVRVNAVLDWPDEAVDEYFAVKGLLRHPLFYRGYGSVGDWTLTTPGERRTGRNLGPHSECGLHIPRAEPAAVA